MLNYPIPHQETIKEYESVASADLLETIRLDFPELKAEAYSSLSSKPVLRSKNFNHFEF